MVHEKREQERETDVILTNGRKDNNESNCAMHSYFAIRQAPLCGGVLASNNNNSSSSK